MTRLPISGLSPHIRGNGNIHGNFTHDQGSIPAHTGERAARRGKSREFGVYPRTYGGTTVLLSIPLILAVYPRTYGGTHTLSAESAYEPGLSPHIRGNEGVTS